MLIKNKTKSTNKLKIFSGHYSNNFNSYNLGYIASNSNDIKIAILNITIFLSMFILLVYLYFYIGDMLAYYLVILISSLIMTILFFIIKWRIDRYLIKSKFNNDDTYSKTTSGTISFSRMNIEDLLNNTQDEFITTYFISSNKIPNKYPFYIHRDDALLLCKNPYVEIDIYESKKGNKSYILPRNFNTRTMYLFDKEDMFNEDSEFDDLSH